MKKLFCLILPLIAAAPFFSCASIVSGIEKTGQILDGSAFAEKKIARFTASVKKGADVDMEIIEAQNKEGERSLVISLKEFPAIKIRGAAPDAQGNFWLNSLEYVSGNTSGWNKYTLEIVGTGKFIQSENGAVFSVNPEIHNIQISQGKIRRYETLISGNDALTNLRNRESRIEAVTEWMSGQENAPKELDRKDFADYWKPVLFPEICAERKRPFGWRGADDVWSRADEIRWNTSYSERTFPEELRPVRDSGTLLRDWEEAFEWIYMRYEWTAIVTMLSGETALTRVK